MEEIIEKIISKVQKEMTITIRHKTYTDKQLEEFRKMMERNHEC